MALEMGVTWSHVAPIKASTTLSHIKNLIFPLSTSLTSNIQTQPFSFTYHKINIKNPFPSYLTLHTTQPLKYLSFNSGVL